MTRYIALLRGINVGGNAKVPMPELKRTFGSLGFDNVKTYINSGNVAFDVGATSPLVRKGSTGEESKLTERIELAIEEHFSLRIQVMLRRRSVIANIIDDNPYAGQFESHKEMHVLFMKDEMPADKQARLLAEQTENERFAVRGREIYCHLRLAAADSLLGKGFIEKKLKVPITARNWSTVEKLRDL